MQKQSKRPTKKTASKKAASKKAASKKTASKKTASKKKASSKKVSSKKAVLKGTTTNGKRPYVVHDQEGVEEFIRIFQTAESLAEVAEKAGWTIAKTSSFATSLRKKGVPLKRFRRTARYDIQKLADLAKEIQFGEIGER